jgi:hypothetical protein
MSLCLPKLPSGKWSASPLDKWTLSFDARSMPEPYSNRRKKKTPTTGLWLWSSRRLHQLLWELPLQGTHRLLFGALPDPGLGERGDVPWHVGEVPSTLDLCAAVLCHLARVPSFASNGNRTDARAPQRLEGRAAAKKSCWGRGGVHIIHSKKGVEV